MRTAGTRFSFAVPEGTDIVSPSFTDTSTLALIAMSPYDGKGVIYSPSGIEINFTFKANRAAIIILPYQLMLLRDLGKSKKGIIVYTTEPINLTYFTIMPYASESSQIYPDDALGTDYLVNEWGLWNDITENNKTQIVVTANEDATDITIIPTVDCLGGHLANVPITTRLDRGECYIIKADSDGAPANISLCRSRVTSSKPVSVMSAATCSYVPLGMQACNPLIDHLLPKKEMLDTVFYASSMWGPEQPCRLLFISDTLMFFVVSSSGLTYQTNTGRLVVPLTGADRFLTSAPALCHELTSGSDVTPYGESDPSMTPVIPERNWIDTMLWFSPSLSTTFSSLANYVSFVYPSDRGDEILLDGLPITAYPQVVPIANSPISGIMIPINSGEHKLTSPVPLCGVSSGFTEADAFSNAITGIAPLLPVPNPLGLHIASDSARTCKDFTAHIFLDSAITLAEHVEKVKLTITYDASVLTPLSVKPDISVAPISSVDNSKPGTITMMMHSQDGIAISGEMLAIVFETGQTQTVTQVDAALDASQIDFAVLPYRSGQTQKVVSIGPGRDTSSAHLSVIARSETLGDTTMATIFLETPISGSYSEVRIRLKYNHDLFVIAKILDPSTLLTGWDSKIVTVDNETDDIIFTPKPGDTGKIPFKGILTRLRLATFVTDTNATEIGLSGFFTSSDPCGHDLLGLDTTGTYTGIDTCGDPAFRSHFKTIPLAIVSIVPMPIRSQFEITIGHSYPAGTPIDFSLIDLLGNAAWSTSQPSAGGPQEKFTFTIPASVSSGTYILTVTAEGEKVGEKVLVTK
jgi:hypothetical protein